MNIWIFHIDQFGANVFLSKGPGIQIEFCYEMVRSKSKAASDEVEVRRFHKDFMEYVAAEIELTCRPGTSLLISANRLDLEGLLEKLVSKEIVDRLLGVIPTDICRFSEEDLSLCAHEFRKWKMESQRKKIAQIEDLHAAGLELKAC